MSSKPLEQDWRQLVPACFGKADKEFAIHPEDEHRARKAVSAAKKAGASRDDFQKEMILFLDNNVSDQFVHSMFATKQTKKLHKLWK